MKPYPPVVQSVMRQHDAIIAAVAGKLPLAICRRLAESLAAIRATVGDIAHAA